MADKPPAITVGVEGIDATPITMDPAVPERVNWYKVGTLPPFQMFVQEREGLPTGWDSQRWAIEYAVRYCAQRGDDALLDEYKEWHASKGYWPNETPLGEVIEEARSEP